jgi:hypothetical protein
MLVIAHEKRVGSEIASAVRGIVKRVFGMYRVVYEGFTLDSTENIPHLGS